MDNKDEDMTLKTDTKRRMEGFKTTKPTVMLKYPETIHFSITCMIRGTDLANWDEIWYVSNQIDRHVCYKLDAFCNIKEDFSVTKLKNQKKFLFTYGIGEVLIEDGGQGFLVPGVHYEPKVTLNILSLDLLKKQGFEVKYDGNRCTLSYIFNNKEVQIFDEDKLRTMQNKYLEDHFESITKKDESIEQDLVRIKGNLYSIKIYLFDLYKLIEGLGGYVSVYFCQEFDTIGEIIGLSRGNGEEIKRCYINYLDVFTSHFKTARAPQQGYNNTLVESAWKVEKDRDCLGLHQWDFGENGAPMSRPAVLKGEKTLEHFGVKLEDTGDNQEQPILPHSTEGQNLQRMYSGPSTSRTHEERGSSTSSTCDDFRIIT
uniref:ARID DNA-binding domain-containing protein n=1 Tax=Tanacetum cinerariifolium TaxID=118510 RepID=A0A699HHK7_TANCI|nr:ARID DNA-binding domain-containing protein [Tanacetum cinerariifolium]